MPAGSMARSACIYGARGRARVPGRPGCGDAASMSWLGATRRGISASFIGSRSFLGLLDEEEIDSGTNRYDGTPLRDALERGGLRRAAARCRSSRGATSGFLEAHIEQGDTLESSGLKIGVVTSHRRDLAVPASRSTGEQNHAGTTTHGGGATPGSRWCGCWGRSTGAFPRSPAPRTVWTTGRITLDPGAPSIIPGRAEMLFQFRDADPAVLDRLQAKLHGWSRRRTRRSLPRSRSR